MSSSWPPYQLLEGATARAEAQLERVERLYHVGQTHAWDGRAVLTRLIEEHGRPRLPDDKREATLKILSLLLWGELAAWSIAADLAEHLEDLEARMAATSQAHDEARHFYVLRDYLHAVGEPVPRLGGLTRRLFQLIFDTPAAAHKLVAMQLLAESNALGLFRGLCDAEVEPVLSCLLPYYEKDEARHVGLGVLYLPRLISRMSQLELARLWAFQLRITALTAGAAMTLEPSARAVGMDARRVAVYTARLQGQLIADMHVRGRVARLVLFDPTLDPGPAWIDFLYPPDPARMSRLHRRAHAAFCSGAALLDRALA
jgi:hypothetical protein